ncbi:putative lipopolysaccharide-responsive [Sesbania bispinosa]|nr:putative lipopolysaccharide-responsive [Sesbania bispinosa]
MSRGGLMFRWSSCGPAQPKRETWKIDRWSRTLRRSQLVQAVQLISTKASMHAKVKHMPSTLKNYS